MLNYFVGLVPRSLCFLSLRFPWDVSCIFLILALNLAYFDGFHVVIDFLYPYFVFSDDFFDFIAYFCALKLVYFDDFHDL